MIEIFVPGRLCLFGEHSDWAGAMRVASSALAPGACIITGTDQGIHARATPADHFEMVSRLPDGTVRGPFACPMHSDELRAVAGADGFFSYAAGVAALLREQYEIGGVHVEVGDMDLPLGRGLSSSAAVCVLTARAFNLVYDLGLDLRAEMELAYRGELLTGSQCGRMDQACAYGNRLVRLDFDGEEMRVEPLHAGGAMYLLVVDLCHVKDTRRILADLHAAFVADGNRAAELRYALGEGNLDIVERARHALEIGDAAAVGDLMNEAQARFDELIAPACPAELRSPRLHALLDDPSVRDLVWGGKGVGSQGDGSAQLVCRDAERRRLLAARLHSGHGYECLPLTIRPSRR